MRRTACTLAYNASHAPQAMRRVARALGASDAPSAVFGLLSRHAAPRSLAELGLPVSGLDRVAEMAVQNPYPNPRPLDPRALREMLQRAYEGRAPSATRRSWPLA